MRHQQSSWHALFSFSEISPKTQTHLRNVYALLAVLVLNAALGTWFAIWMDIGTRFATLGLVLSLVLTIFIVASAGNPALQTARLVAAAFFAFVNGCSIAPLVNLAITIDPALIVTALSTSVVIFASFTGAALYSRRRSLLFLGGLLGSAISVLLVLSLLTFFIRSLAPFSFNLNLYLGLIVFSLYIVYDTQLIVEKAELGDFDYVQHTLDLFIDLIAIFVRILIILLKNLKEDKKK